MPQVLARGRRSHRHEGVTAAASTGKTRTRFEASDIPNYIKEVLNQIPPTNSTNRELRGRAERAIKRHEELPLDIRMMIDTYSTLSLGYAAYVVRESRRVFAS